MKSFSQHSYDQDHELAVMENFIREGINLKFEQSTTSTHPIVKTTQASKQRWQTLAAKATARAMCGRIYEATGGQG